MEYFQGGYGKFDMTRDNTQVEIVIVLLIFVRKYRSGCWTCCCFCAVVNPNNKFEIYVDQSLIHSGSLLEDMTSVVVTVITVQLLSVHLPVCVSTTASAACRSMWFSSVWYGDVVVKVGVTFVIGGLQVWTLVISSQCVIIHTGQLTVAILCGYAQWVLGKAEK